MRPSIRRRSSCGKPARRAMPAMGTALCPGAGEWGCPVPELVAGDQGREPGCGEFRVFLVLEVRHMEQWSGVYGAPLPPRSTFRTVRPVRPCMCSSGDWMVAVVALYWMK